MSTLLFKNRRLLIATKHERKSNCSFAQKKQVICFVNENFDTDLLGTFTGEIENSTHSNCKDKMPFGNETKQLRFRCRK
jgi:hypothetical protein